MAERRMFAKTIVLSDDFLDMPMSARCLYFTLGMLADDDGFVNAPKSIMRQCGASADDMKVLLSKRFLLAFDSGVIVIKHWRINNYLQADRIQPTKYVEEKAMLSLSENRAYHLTEEDNDQCIHSTVYIDQNREEKNSIAQNSVVRFKKPTVQEVQNYCKERGNNVDPDRFIDYYDSNGWKVGKNPMKDWKAAVRTWERGDSTKPKKYTTAAEYKAPSSPKSVEELRKLVDRI